MVSGGRDMAMFTSTGWFMKVFAKRRSSCGMVAEKRMFWRDGQLFDHCHNIVKETHVEHSVGFVKDKVFHFGEVD